MQLRFHFVLNTVTVVNNRNMFVFKSVQFNITTNVILLTDHKVEDLAHYFYV